MHMHLVLPTGGAHDKNAVKLMVNNEQTYNSSSSSSCCCCCSVTRPFYTNGWTRKPDVDGLPMAGTVTTERSTAGCIISIGTAPGRRRPRLYTAFIIHHSFARRSWSKKTPSSTVKQTGKN